MIFVINQSHQILRRLLAAILDPNECELFQPAKEERRPALPGQIVAPAYY